jgi:hypothetical protein
MFILLVNNLYSINKIQGAGNFKVSDAQQGKISTPLEMPGKNYLKLAPRYGSTKYVKQNG